MTYFARWLGVLREPNQRQQVAVVALTYFSNPLATQLPESSSL